MEIPADLDTAARPSPEQMLAADALDPRAWTELAIRHGVQGDKEAAFKSLLVATVMMRDLPRGWLTTLATALDASVPSATVADIVHAGLFFCEDSFSELVQDAERALRSDDAARAVRAAFYQHANTAPRRREPLALRLPQLDWEAMVISESG